MTDLHASVKPWNARWRAMVYEGPDCFAQVRGCEAYVRAISDKMVAGASVREVMAFLAGVRITAGQPVVNDNDPAVSMQAVWYSETDAEWVQRAKEPSHG